MSLLVTSAAHARAGYSAASARIIRDGGLPIPVVAVKACLLCRTALPDAGRRSPKSHYGTRLVGCAGKAKAPPEGGSGRGLAPQGCVSKPKPRQEQDGTHTLTECCRSIP